MNEWLDGVFGAVRCASCGTTYRRDGIVLVGNNEDHWFVRCTCRSCGTEGLGVVIVKRVAEGPPASATEATFGDAAPALRVDDVLEAHDVLRDYAGDAHGLFESVPRR